MKKILSMVLAAVMCATMMVGCGGSRNLPKQIAAKSSSR